MSEAISLVPRPLSVFHAENEGGPGISSHVIGKGTGWVEILSVLTTAFCSYRFMMDVNSAR